MSFQGLKETNYSYKKIKIETILGKKVEDNKAKNIK